MTSQAHAHLVQVWRAIYGAVGGGVFVALTQILTRDTLTLPLRWAVLLFAASLPILALSYIYLPPLDQPPRRGIRRFFFFVSETAVGAAIIGFGLLFWHLDRVAGVIFAVSVGVCIGLTLRLRTPPSANG
jgi:hypothetical protein